MKITSALFSLAIASSVVSAHQNLLQSRHHPHDAVVRRAAALSERGDTSSEGWVRKRQAVPVDDDEDEDVTTVSFKRTQFDSVWLGVDNLIRVAISNSLLVK